MNVNTFFYNKNYLFKTSRLPWFLKLFKYEAMANLWTLVIDTSTPITFVGCLSDGHWKSHTQLPTHALEGLFKGVDECLNLAEISLPELNRIVYCGGPGSTLGLRVATMAIKTWNKIYPHIQIETYTSLEYACFHLPERSAVISKTGQAGWYVCQKEVGGKISHIELSVHLSHLPQDTSIFELPHFKHGLGKGPSSPMCAYPFEKLPETLQVFPEIFKEVRSIEPFSLVDPTYAVWNEQRHR
jgi:hypothetical protein